jgi:tape measure domain-containing protein
MGTTIGQMAVMVSANSSGFTAGFGAMSNTLGGFIANVGKLGALVGVTSGIGEGIKTAFSGFAEMESNQVAFETLLKDAGKAKVLMGDLAKFGADTPFQLPELTKAGKSLVAMGVGADTVVTKLRQLGDISALLSEPIGELATLYGKAKTDGVVMGETINQFTGRGIPLIGELAKQFGVAESQVRKLASEGKVGFADLDKAIVSLTTNGGLFQDGMLKQAGTMKGIWSNLTDNISMSMTRFGQGIVTVFGIKDGLKGLSDLTGEIQLSLSTWAEGIGSFAPYVQQTFATIGSVITGVWEIISLGGQALVGTLGMIFGEMGAGAVSFKDLFVDAMLNVRFIFSNLGDYWEIGWEKMKLAAVIVGNDLLHLFTVNIPEMLSWFGRQWKNVFTDVYNITVTIFTNIGKNIWNFFKNIPGLIAGTTTFAEIWTPLTDGFKSSITEALQVTKRDLSDWEKEQLGRVGTMEAKLAQTKAEWMKKEKAQFASDLAKANTPAAIDAVTSPGKSVAAALTSAAMSSKKADEKKYTGAIEAGSKEAYNVILRSRDFNGPAQKTAVAAEKTAKNTEKQLDRMDDLITAVEASFGEFGGLGLDDGSNL